MEKKKGKKSLLKKLSYHYRILVIDDDSYENKLSFKLNRLNVFVGTFIFAMLLIVGTSLLIAFTPIKTYIPGYTAPELRKNALLLKLKTDSLKMVVNQNDYYLQQLQKVLRNEISVENFEKTIHQKKLILDTLNLAPSKEDSLLRKEVADREKFNINQRKSHLVYNFVAPAKGVITNTFNQKRKHFAVDIALENNTPIKAIADGVVIFSDWTQSTGQVIIIEHNNNVISTYKHNNKLLRKTGDKITQGEVIALSGNSGQKTSGPHLHFELWIKGYPINPTDFINFNK